MSRSDAAPFFAHPLLRPTVGGLCALACSVSLAQSPPAVSPPSTVASLPLGLDALASTDWNQLTASQHRALAPLESSWPGLDETRRRKWLSISQNYPSMSPDGQARLHSRMREWAALSPKERTLARLNFAEAQVIPLDEKRAKWEAYQALSPEEKRRLADSAPPKVKGAAPAIKPTPQKLVRPATAASAPQSAAASSPRTRVFQPDRVDPRTLLPRVPPGSQP